MSGGLLQLVAYGAQDIYLTSSPEITLFKSIYRRYTNFAMESIEQVFTGNADFGRKVTATISRSGDLIHKTYLQAEFPEINSHISGRWTDDVGHHLIRLVELEIGGQKIDRHYGEWLQIWAALTVPADKKVTYNKMVGMTAPMCTYSSNSKPQTILYVPLQFFFCQYVGLSLPLIALQYHEVKINVELRAAEHLWITDSDGQRIDENIRNAHLLNCSLWIDYIYLDTDERRRFAQISHEYLIEQLQYNGEEAITSTSSRIRLNFNHPCKALYWVVQKDSHIGAPGQLISNQWSNFQLDALNVTDTTFSMYDGENYGVPHAGNMSTTKGVQCGSTSGNPVTYAKLQLNGNDRFAGREGSYFNLVQIYQSHPVGPLSEGINVYSFGLENAKHQPEGTINFSRIDTAVLQFSVHPGTFIAVNALDNESTTTGAKVRIYTVNYNVLRIMSGMAGVAYAN